MTTARLYENINFKSRNDDDDDNNTNVDDEKKTGKKKRVVSARDVAHFEFIDDNQIVFAQRNSKNILYAELTKAVHSPSQVYLFGKHENPVSCLAVNANSKIDIVASGATDGSLFVHTIKDGKKKSGRVEGRTMEKAA